MNEHFDDCLYDYSCGRDETTVMVTYDEESNSIVVSTRARMGDTKAVWPYYWKKTNGRFRLYFSVNMKPQWMFDKALSLLIDNGLWLRIDTQSFKSSKYGANFVFTKGSFPYNEKEEIAQVFNQNSYVPKRKYRLSEEERTFLDKKSKEFGKDILASINAYFGCPDRILKYGYIIDKYIKDLKLEDKEEQKKFGWIFINLLYDNANTQPNKVYAIKSIDGEEKNICANFEEATKLVENSGTFYAKIFENEIEAREWLSNTSMEKALKGEKKLQKKIRKDNMIIRN